MKKKSKNWRKRLSVDNESYYKGGLCIDGKKATEEDLYEFIEDLLVGAIVEAYGSGQWLKDHVSGEPRNFLSLPELCKKYGIKNEKENNNTKEHEK